MNYDIIEQLWVAEFHTLEIVRMEQVFEALHSMHKFEKV